MRMMLRAVIDTPTGNATIRDRAVVLEQHLTEHTAPQWVAAWEQAVDNRARSRRKGA